MLLYSVQAVLERCNPLDNIVATKRALGGAGIFTRFADSAGPTLGPILNYLSITQHFDDFGKGVIDTKHIIYYLSFISFGLFLTLKSVDSERWRG